MFFSETRRQLIPTTYVAGVPSLPLQPEWVLRAREFVARYTMAAVVIAAAALIVAAAIPAVAAIQQTQSTGSQSALRSSAGVTGTAGTRVENLSAASFVGGIPFVQQARNLDALAGAVPEGRLFVQGVRQASVAEYLQDVGAQIALPYLGATATTKESIDTWTAALAEQQAALTAQQAALPSAPYKAVWQTALPAAGTVIPGATVTFYSCISSGFCGLMANGQQVFDGAAACSYDLPFGTRFMINSDPTSRVFTCLDRGALASSWVDIWFYDPADGWAWQAMIGGTRGDITIVQ